MENWSLPDTESRTNSVEKLKLNTFLKWENNWIYTLTMFTLFPEKLVENIQNQNISCWNYWIRRIKKKKKKYSGKKSKSRIKKQRNKTTTTTHIHKQKYKTKQKSQESPGLF